MLDYDQYRSLRLVRHDDGVLEIVMTCRPGQKLPTADDRTHYEMTEVWRTLDADPTMKVAVIRAEVTKEGERLRRVHDLALIRSTSPSFILTWMTMHPITKDSPLYGMTAAQLQASESEIIVTLTGLDETLGQTIHARTSYLPSEVRYGARFVDVIGGMQDGKRVIDLTKFHDTMPSPLNREAMGLSPDIG